MKVSWPFRLLLQGYAVSLCCLCVWAGAENYSGADLTSWKWGAGFASFRTGYQVGLGIISPIFVDMKVERNTMSAFLDGNLIYHIDAYSAGGKWKSAESQNLAAGLRMTRTMSQTIQSYVKFGADYMFWDKDFKTSGGDDQSLGLLVTIGGDLITGAMTGWLVGDATHSLYIEALGRFGHKRTDGISGSPDMFNGFGIAIGGRHHY